MIEKGQLPTPVIANSGYFNKIRYFRVQLENVKLTSSPPYSRTCVNQNRCALYKFEQIRMIIPEIIAQAAEKTANSEWYFNLGNTILGAGIGSGVTVWALYRTFKHDKKKEEEKRIQFQQEKIKYLQSLLRIILQNLKIQIENYKTFALAIESDLFNLPLLSEVTLNELKRIVHQIDQEDYYHSYLGEFGHSKEIVDEFRNIISLLNYYDGNIQNYKTSLEKSFSFDYDRKIELKTIVENAMDRTAGHLIESELQNEKEFLEFMNNLMIEFHNKATSSSDLKFYFENYVEKMKKGLIHFMRDIPQAHLLMIEMKKATYIYNDIQLQNKNVSNDFMGLYSEMMDYYPKLEKNTERIMQYN
ncbi:hypothetical protein C7S20_12610 [Christiangramia fulva]|uniref:Uncharacterized protein n=1 Tax=Christiangramia fulva TaxID=2126553 RepID=A0A2R3Z6V6_9FLAO|nr:hypothetical protein [Christiangramia fulva]AVR46027.1 hypothetical protein C7S20_12610 [Christiangramia fulva]